jgi:lipoprotein-anchoring transpeptidase ErfK/SrfK
MTHLRVSISRQTVEVVDGESVLWQAPVSTSRFGTGTEPGSFKTPLGSFTIVEKIGDGAPRGAIFRGRVATGELWTPGQITDDDLILTRILWLDGTTPDNAHTRARFIYFHGTNHEDQIGTPASHGCIRLKNDDVIALYAWVTTGTPVDIRED